MVLWIGIVLMPIQIWIPIGVKTMSILMRILPQLLDTLESTLLVIHNLFSFVWILYRSGSGKMMLIRPDPYSDTQHGYCGEHTVRYLSSLLSVQLAQYRTYHAVLS